MNLYHCPADFDNLGNFSGDQSKFKATYVYICYSYVNMFPVIFPVIFPFLMIITSVASFQATEELGYQRDRARHHEVGAPLSAIAIRWAQVLEVKSDEFWGSVRNVVEENTESDGIVDDSWISLI